MSQAVEIAIKSIATGVAGWGFENVFVGPKYPAGLGRIPILPAYVAGGAAIALMVPRMVDKPWAQRALTYAIVLSSIEFVGCQINRKLMKSCSWDYSKQACEKPLEGCIGLQYAALWGLLGLVMEKLI